MAHKVKIAARLRPRIAGEVDDGGIQVLRAEDGHSFISVANPRDSTQIFKFPFSSCYDEHSKQEEIFERDVRPMIDVVYSGVTVTIFAYGVTSSGKTHTMQGTPEEPGVIPRVVKAMFDRRGELGLADASLTMSYIEIYKDEVYDLLGNRAEAPKLPVRENDSGQVFVANLTTMPVESAADFDAHYARSNKQRSVGATNLNNKSSRSHAVLTIEVHMPDTAQGRIITGKINLVDLAGSENNKLTGNDPSRMAESSAINKSLSVLGQVVHALNSGASRIPYRNSKLTRLLQDALGGSSVGLLICNLAPGNKFRQDTLNTLNFAVRTKNVENKPVVNERDARPPPKPHFAAVSHTRPRGPPAQISALAAGPLPPLPEPANTSAPAPVASTAPAAAATSSSGMAQASLPARGRRPSMVPLASGSRVPRPSIMTGGPVLPGLRSATGSFAPPIAEEDMEEKIRRLVEAEVNRRLEDVRAREENDRVRLADVEARRARELDVAEPRPSIDERSLLLDTKPPFALPEADESAGDGRPDTSDETKVESDADEVVLASIMRGRASDISTEVEKRLVEIEKKIETGGDKEAKMVEQMSPASRKKTGRAYVAVARAHSDKGNMQAAVDFYRRAELYVPDNLKLKERIIEIEWCLKEGKPFHASPKAKKTKPATKKSRSSKSRRSGGDTAPETPTPTVGSDGEDRMEVEELISADAPSAPSKRKSQRKRTSGGDEPTFGTEVTNSATPGSPGKRTRADGDNADAEDPAAPKRKRRSAAERKSVVLEIMESEDEEPPQPRRSKRTAAAAASAEGR